MTTLEDAKRCPTCKEAGEALSSRPVREGSGGRADVFICRNERCRDVGERWIVQVRPDGSIPEHKPGDKHYRAMSNDMLAMGRRVVEDAVQRDLRDEES